MIEEKKRLNILMWIFILLCSIPIIHFLRGYYYENIIKIIVPLLRDGLILIMILIITKTKLNKYINLVQNFWYIPLILTIVALISSLTTSSLSYIRFLSPSIIIIEEIIMLLLYIFIINYLKEISLKYFEKETIIKQNKNNKKVIDQLKEYEEMKNKKYITDEEYEILKKNLLGIDGEEKWKK